MISEKPLFVVLKNFQRNRMVNLTATSVKHFLPNASIYCLTLYKESMDEYASQEPLLPFITEFTEKTKFVSGKDIHDSNNPHEVSGFGHPNNGAFFAEGYNMIFEKFRGSDQKVLMLAEDHFFTSGQTLREVVDVDWDLAYGPWAEWQGCYSVNGSILGVVPSKVGHCFPVGEMENVTVEWLFYNMLIRQVDKDRVHAFSTRREDNYFGDGMYTNSSEVIEEKMREAGIL